MTARFLVLFISVLSFLISDSLTLQNLNLDEGTIDVYMINSNTLGGMQFGLPGLEITGASGGLAENQGWAISINSTTVLGFSMTGAAISPGLGILTTLDVELGDDPNGFRCGISRLYRRCYEDHTN